MPFMVHVLVLGSVNCVISGLPLVVQLVHRLLSTKVLASCAGLSELLSIHRVPVRAGVPE